ncbi:MAG: hypothetical protein WC770_09760 [Phycisphaerae bacterium]|jgi:hypothetical protein
MADIINNTRFQSAEKEGLCPICGERMKEVDRMKEGLNFFVWFKCRRENCDGQWLQKQFAWQMEHTGKTAVSKQENSLAYYEKLVSP